MNFYPGTVTEKGIVTNKHDWFELDRANREIDEEKIKTFKKKLNSTAKEGEYPFRSPVVVYWTKGMEKGRINMGHHRFEYCRKNGLNVNYVITDSPERADEDQVREGQDWDTEQRVRANYIKYTEGQREFEDYALLFKLRNEFPRYSLNFLTVAFNGKSASTKAIDENRFRINNKNQPLKRARIRIEMYEEFLSAADRKDKSREIFMRLIEAINNPIFDWDYFIKRTKVNAPAINMKAELRSINNYAQAETLIMYLYNTNSRKNFYF